MRTILNVNYARGGTGPVNVVKELYKEGGIRRFYRGVAPAMIQGPLSRYIASSTHPVVCSANTLF
jgi:hypothetical protein